MIFEIINPSDAVTLEADDKAIACVACLLLGEGRYALEDEESADVMPLFLGDEEALQEWMAASGVDVKRILETKRAEVAACLESAMCCGKRDRQAIMAAVGDDLDARARYNEVKRSSLNDICGRAALLAAKLREAPAEE